MRAVEIPDEILDLLRDSTLAGRTEAEGVGAALAIHLFQEGLVSIGKAAELAGTPRVEFELLLTSLGIPVVRYDVADYEDDGRGIAEASQRGPS